MTQSAPDSTPPRLFQRAKNFLTLNPVRVGLFCLLSTAFLCALTAGPCADPATKNRVIAVADVHGDLGQFLAILRRTGLVNEQNRWAGDCTTLIQVGDLIDRGPHDRAVLDLIMELQQNAPRHGGQVLAAVGNHEVMNVMGDLRYVTRDSFSFFTDSETEKRRKAALEQYRAYLKQRARFFGRPELDGAVDEARWLEEHPAGFFERRSAFSARGKYGKWIRKGSAIVRHGNILYLHGGLSEEITNPVAKLNERIRHELKLFDNYVDYLTRRDVILPFFRLEQMMGAVRQEAAYWESASSLGGGPRTPKPNHLNILQDFLEIGNWISMHPDGPLWFRGYAEWSEEEGPARIETVLKTYGVDHVVVGHTPMLKTGISTRFGGRIILIDTGLNTDFYSRGQPSALEIHNGEFHAVYLADRQELLPDPDAFPRSRSTGGSRSLKNQSGGLLTSPSTSTSRHRRSPSFGRIRGSTHKPEPSTSRRRGARSPLCQ